jgi:hypothetical protein
MKKMTKGKTIQDVIDEYKREFAIEKFKKKELD